MKRQQRGHGPRRLTKHELARFGIETSDGWEFCCARCGRKWVPYVRGRLRKPPLWWRCAHGCNNPVRVRRELLKEWRKAVKFWSSPECDKELDRRLRELSGPSSQPESDDSSGSIR